VTIVRLIIYLTPLIIPALLVFIKRGLDTLLQRQISVSLLILGMVNLVFLPTATWGHSYFLYYFTPIAAVIFGVLLSELSQRKFRFLIAFLSLFLISGYSVAVSKNYQQQKQVWKYGLATSINSLIAPHETVAVVNFPGDILENYYFHPTFPVSSENLTDYFRLNPHRAVLIACGVDECHDSEPDIVEGLTGYEIRHYIFGENQAWLILKSDDATSSYTTETVILNGGLDSRKPYILELYRVIRDLMGGIQI